MPLDQLQITVKPTGEVTGEVFREQAIVTSKEIKKIGKLFKQLSIEMFS